LFVGNIRTRSFRTKILEVDPTQTSQGTPWPVRVICTDNKWKAIGQWHFWCRRGTGKVRTSLLDTVPATDMFNLESRAPPKTTWTPSGVNHS
jgi:hypothetical protein